MKTIADGLVRCMAMTLVWWLAAASVAAQAPTPEPPPRVEATAQLSYLGATGNSSTQTLGVSGDWTYRTQPWIYSAKAAFLQNEDHDVLRAKSFLGLFRADRSITARASAYGQYAFLRDRFAGIESRHTIEGGLAYLLVDQAPHRLRIDGAVGYQNEHRLTAADLSSFIVAGGLGYKWALSKTSELADDFRIVLPVAETAAWHLDQTVSLTAAISAIFSLKVSNTIRFVNQPPPGFEDTDTITAVSLVMRIRRPQRAGQ